MPQYARRQPFTQGKDFYPEYTWQGKDSYELWSYPCYNYSDIQLLSKEDFAQTTHPGQSREAVSVFTRTYSAST